MQTNGHGAYIVGTREHMVGVITAAELADARRSGCGKEPVHTLLTNAFTHVHPDHALDIVLERFGESAGLLPVVSRASVQRVEGVITLDDITRFATRGHGRRAADRAGLSESEPGEVASLFLVQRVGNDAEDTP